MNKLCVALALVCMLAVDTTRGQIVNPCASNPCQSGGRCVFLAQKNFMYCICPNIFSGPFCSGALPSSTSTTTTSSTASTSSTTTASTSSNTTTTSTTSTTSTTTTPTTAANATLYRCADRDYACRNGGKCYFSVNVTRITCQCAPTYTGTFCDQRTSYW